MDKRSVYAGSVQCGRCVYTAVLRKDSITFGVTCAAAVALDDRDIFLIGISPCNGAGNKVSRTSVTVK